MGSFYFQQTTAGSTHSIKNLTITHSYSTGTILFNFAGKSDLTLEDVTINNQSSVNYGRSVNQNVILSFRNFTLIVPNVSYVGNFIDGHGTGLILKGGGPSLNTAVHIYGSVDSLTVNLECDTSSNQAIRIYFYASVHGLHSDLNSGFFSIYIQL